MNDELDLLRHLRPSAAGPAPEVVHREREHLLEFIATSTGPRHRRPRGRIAASVFIPVLAVTGVAAATGLIPSAVTDRFGGLEQRSGSAIDIDTDQATIVGEAEAGRYRVELWTAPTSGDRQCLYVRSMWDLDDSTSAENGPVGCFDQLPVVADPTDPAFDVADLLAVLDVVPLGHPVTSGGVSPGEIATAITGAVDSTVASIDIEFSDGRHTVVDVNNPLGWVATILDEDITRPDANGVFANPATKVTLRDARNNPIATLDDWASLQATAIVVE